MSSVVISGDSSGQVSLTVPSVAGTNTATLPAATGTVMVSGNMPAFSYWQSVAQTLSSATFTKITLTSSNFDTTSGMYASSRFTPTVAGYYQVNGSVGIATTGTRVITAIYRTGANIQYGNDSGAAGTVYTSAVSGVIYLNGSTDYVELWCYFGTGQNTAASQVQTYFNCAMVRGA
jgi:hypothetical protein